MIFLGKGREQKCGVRMYWRGGGGGAGGGERERLSLTSARS